jgi:hypothetical protein
MPQHDIRAAAHDRDAGLAKITALSWRAGAAGVVIAGLLTFAFGHDAAASGGAAAHRPGVHRNNQGTILIPAQPPAPATGGGQVTSGAS